MRPPPTPPHARLGGPGQWLLNLPPSYVAGLQVLFRSLLAGTDPVVQGGSFEDAAAAMTGGAALRLAGADAAAPAARRRAPSCAASTPCWSAAARLDPALRARAVDAGVRVVSTYGMSETVRRLRLRRPPARRGRGQDRRRRPGPDRRAGRLHRVRRAAGRSPRPPRRAAGSSPRTSAASTTTGCSQVTGRVDDVVISGGVNVPAPAVAARLRDHPGVRDAEVVGVPDAEWGQARRRGARRRPSRSTTCATWVARRAPARLGARAVVPVAALPLLANGKVDRLAVERIARRLGPARRTFPVGGTSSRSRCGPGSGGSRCGRGCCCAGDAGWGEFSPFLEYDARVAAPWLAAAREAADDGWPEPLRDTVPVNVTVPAVGPEQAAAVVRASSGCRTAKVKVAEPGQTLADEQARLEAVRDALGPDGPDPHRRQRRCGRSTRRSLRIPLLDRAAGGLEYVEQPVMDVEDLAAGPAPRRRAGRRGRVDPAGRGPLPGARPARRRRRGAQGAAARRRARLPADRRGHRPAGRGVQRPGDERRDRRRRGAGGRAAGAALRLRPGHGAAAHRRRRGRAAAAARRCPARRTTGGRRRTPWPAPPRRRSASVTGATGWPAISSTA